METDLGSVDEDVQGTSDGINISDVIEVIQTDPDFRQPPSADHQQMTNAGPSMFNGGNEVPQLSPQQQQHGNGDRSQVRVVIREQPAPKALRFRYECEGRSAGSIPGISSTPENKTYPTIEVVGYRGRAVVVVSCVTKDPPYKAHPHNLVGREGCKRGVCTLEFPPETMTVGFQNLGIQCVKRKDIENALKTREEIRVDPFRQGFNHRSQHTSIDLNAVRLCFQVFLEGDTPRRFSKPLAPVVSEPIYDKKAMSDLNIIKLSDCTAPVDGGRKDIILLCEKVAKEDIQVRFYMERNGQVLWEANADFQPSQVHKQHAIWFKPPAYHSKEITEPVSVFIQLRRPSDGIVSEPLPFQYLPFNAGRPPYWSFRRNIAKKANYDLFNSILGNDLVEKQLPAKEKPREDIGFEKTNIEVMETNNNEPKAPEIGWDYSQVKKIQTPNDDSVIRNNTKEEKSFNELINQVAELDEIYSETQARLLNECLNDVEKPTLQNLPQNESFDDARTYSSLQLAFKNPIEIELVEKYEDVALPPPSPVPPEIPSNKRENDVERLPPLPPKRSKKIETYIGGSMTSIQLTGKQAENLLTRSNSSLKSKPVSRSQSFNLQGPTAQSQSSLVPPGKRLPPTPNYSTLPTPKKRGFFSKLFGRKSSRTPGTSRETSVAPSNKRNSFSSSKSLQVVGLAKSTGNISTHSANSIRIPLKDSPPSSVQNLAQDNSKVVDMTNDDVDMNLDLTEAENYALYMAMAPHATQSEFDEMSCYYAPVEGGKLLTNAEVMARLMSKS